MPHKPIKLSLSIVLRSQLDIVNYLCLQKFRITINVQFDKGFPEFFVSAHMIISFDKQ